jgi:hypothetical protein
MKICAEGWIITQIGVKPGPIISVNEVVVCPLEDIYVPNHKTHLKVKDSLIGSVVRKDKFDSITVSDPDESTTVAHVASFFHSPVPAKAFTEIGMKMLFIPSNTPGAKRDGVQHTAICFGEEVKTISRHELRRKGQGNVIIISLTYNVAKSLGRKVRV